MSLALQSLVFNLTHCTAGDVTSCNVTCTDVASGVVEVDCAQDGGVFAFSGCRANCAALPAYNVATNPGGVVGAAEVTCAQGSSILHGSVCSPVCKQDTWVNLPVFPMSMLSLVSSESYPVLPPCLQSCKKSEDFMSDVTSLLCNDSAFVPSTFSCGAACAPPDGGPLVSWLVDFAILKLSTTNLNGFESNTSPEFEWRSIEFPNQVAKSTAHTALESNSGASMIAQGHYTTVRRIGFATGVASVSCEMWTRPGTQDQTSGVWKALANLGLKIAEISDVNPTRHAKPAQWWW